MRLLLLTSHSIAEHDDLDMFTRMGVDVFSIGAYTHPGAPSDDKRPPLPDAPRHPDLAAACDEQRARHGADHAGWVIDWAKGDLHPDVVAWADAIVVHHFPEQWIGGNWRRIRDKRVVWRTCGQSDPRLELAMSRYTADGLEVVRYSPREREYFGSIGAFAGEDALIRFGKDPAEWSGWRGDVSAIGNITQHMAQRGDACGFPFWFEATRFMPTRPAGPGSEALANGVGALPFEAMRDYLRGIRAYLYTGTRPASYTLGLIEAVMTGTPTVAMGAGRFEPSALYEGADICGVSADDPATAARALGALLSDRSVAEALGQTQRARAIELFGLDGVMARWREFLGLPHPFALPDDHVPYFGDAA